MDFEKRLKRLEEIVRSMEDGQLPLETSLGLFEEGVKLSKECHSQLAEAEQRVKVLVGINESGNAITQDFKSEL